MPLTPGTRLGVHEIVAPLGAGGMGEVYRARDTRLGRDVAIKVLPATLESDAERLARFEREARLLASLNHPNIAGIYGIDEVEGHRYLVLELVEGETLADRIARGPLPPDEAADVCRGIAEGVEAAHEAGVVHRDLKPGNVMLKPDGGVKVLDFGLAKADSGSATASDPSLTTSPTMTAAATMAGVILGTAAYMSPEQARGRAVDKRSDVWSFGCVLYECLTGRKAFEGETVSDTIAAILRSEPDYAALPAGTSPRVRALLTRCLTRDPRERLRDIGEARVALAPSAESVSVAPTNDAQRGRGVSMGLVAAVALATAAIAVAITLLVSRGTHDAPMRKFELSTEDVDGNWPASPELSPDGSKIAYTSGGKLWIRSLDEVDARALADLEGRSALAWSPDSRELAFTDRKSLWKLPVAGGTPVLLTPVPGTGSAVGLSWSAQGSIAISVWRDGIYSVPGSGGTARSLVAIEPGRIVDFHSPRWLANGDLSYVVHWTNAADSVEGEAHDVELFRGGKRIPIPGALGDEASPVITASGRMLFLRRGTNAGIWTCKFDSAHNRMVGEPQLVAAGAASVSVANDGSLLYMGSGQDDRPAELVWVDRSGAVISQTGQAYPGLAEVALSADGRRVAFTAQRDGQSAVWVRDLARGVDSRITFGKSEVYTPQWLSPDRLMYTERSDPNGSMACRIVAVNADGSGQLTQIAPPTGSSFQLAFFTPDHRTALRAIDEAGHGRLRLSDVEADGTLGALRGFVRFTPEPDVRSFGIDGVGAALSPDGRIVAYTNNDERPGLFAARFPSGEGPWQIGDEGGRIVHWAPGSGALTYIAESGQYRKWLTEVTIDSSQDPPMGRTTHLFDTTPFTGAGGTHLAYDVAAGGQRFLMTREVPGAAKNGAHMVLVQNWQAGLAKK